MAFSVTDLVTSDTGDYINTEGDDRILVRYTNDPFTPSLSFIGSFTARLPLAHQLLTAALSFSGTFLTARKKIFTAVLSFVGTHKIFTPFKRMTASLSFVGKTTKRSPRSFAGTISFSGFFRAVFVILKSLAAATLSFTGSLKPRPRKLFTATVSFIGDYLSKFNGLILKFMGSTVSFIGDIVFPTYSIFLDDSYLDFSGAISRLARPFKVLIASVLRFRTSFSLPWRRLTAMIRAVVQTLGGLVIGSHIENMPQTRVTDTNQSLDTIPVVLPTSGRPYPVLIIYNLDTDNTVEIDSAATFDKFPQIILPGGGVYLSFSNVSTVYARTQSGTAEIRIIAAMGT